MKKKRLTTAEAAAALGVCKQRIDAKIKQGHFPNHTRCECGRAILIPAADVELDRRYRTGNKQIVQPEQDVGV
jgi:excisionase family DNA binding protein